MEPFEVGPGAVYSPSCKKRVHGAGGGSCPGWRWGWEGRRCPHHSRGCLFGNQSGPFSNYYSMSSTDQATLIPGGGAGITDALPDARCARLAWGPCCTWLSEDAWKRRTRRMLGWSRAGRSGARTQEPERRASQSGSVSYFATHLGKKTRLNP